MTTEPRDETRAVHAVGGDVPTRTDILRTAWPIVVANASIPALGLADTAVIGHTGGVTDLGAIALGALIFNFLYFGLGFLRMGTTGFVAQADGAGDEPELRAAVGRALLLAAALGATIVALQWPVIWAALSALGGSDAVESTTRSYFLIRVWGAPASLCTFVVMGCFIGLGRSGLLLRSQLLLNSLNIALDLLFAGVLGWGAEGIALGTAIAEWTSLGYVLWLLRRVLSSRHRDALPLWPWERIRDARRVLSTMSASADILIRTLLLLSSFALFTNQAAAFGDEVLGANHILLQLIGFGAYFLDGYAHAVESVIGRAVGAGRRDVFDAAVLRSTQLAAATALLLSLGLFALGGPIVSALTQHASVRAVAAAHVQYAAAYVMLSFAAFQLDGIFIGATRTRAMRNASLISMAVFLAAFAAIGDRDYVGLWLAFILYVVARALALCLFFPALRRSIAAAKPV